MLLFRNLVELELLLPDGLIEFISKTISTGKFLNISYWQIPYIYPLCFDEMNPSFFPKFPHPPFTYQFYMLSPKNKTKPKKELSACMCMDVGLPTGAWVVVQELHPWRKCIPPSPETVGCQYVLARVDFMSPSPVHEICFADFTLCMWSQIMLVHMCKWCPHAQ